MSKFKTLIFDFDGTIGDSILPHLEVFKKVARALNIDFPEEINLEEHLKMSMKDLVRHYHLGPIKLARAIKMSQEELNKVFDQIDFFEDVEKLLKDANKKYQLGILTSNSRANIDKFIKAKKLTVFNFIYCEQNIFGKDKILKKIISENKLNPQEILYFGDEVRDVEACKKAKIKVAAVSWGFDHREILQKARPDYLFESPSEIRKFLSLGV